MGERWTFKMFKFNLNNQDLIAPCGLYCGECSAFQDGSCGGCISRQGLCLKYTEICKIYDCCVEEKGLRTCCECGEFPCQKLKAFFDTPEWYNDVIGNLQKIKEKGLKKFLDEEVKRVEQLVSCAKRHKIVHCGKCRKWPCSKMKREPLTPA